MDKKMNSLLIAAMSAVLLACGDSDPDAPAPSPDGGDKPGEGGVEDVRTVKSNLVVDLSTDKAVYAPGQTVRFTASELVADAKVRYRQGADVIAEEPMTSTSWTWTPPSKDFTGYMADIYRLTDDKTETVYATIAVDVSSDWTMFPRYGFVATFDDSKLTAGVIEAEMEYLNRCHINGVQFQDWHNKHHWPLGGTRDNPAEKYKDIANRDINASVVRRYIDVQHSYGMKSIFYNLCFGALDDAMSDGVKEQWYIFKDTHHGDKDYHGLPSNWKSNIYLLDPANSEWLAYIGQRNDDVYANFDFDGYQIDQLGNRGDRYRYDGTKVNLPQAYATFINAMKQRHPSKRLIMNAVSSYGAQNIAGTGNVDFCYNEVWGDESEFSHLQRIIKANDVYSDGKLKTVFAAYMNYDKADRTTGEMNNPGVILTDAVMMALGGSHLELGDHMLSREYFPASPLAMNAELKTAMIRYYDFMTAYQNLLRGSSTSDEFEPEISCTDAAKKISLNAWPPKKGGVTAYGRNVGTRQVISLLNFRNVEDLSWRDLEGTRRAPSIAVKLPLSLKVAKNVKKIWVASPDQHAGAVQELAFRQNGDTVTFTVPSLNYWTMIVIE